MPFTCRWPESHRDAGRTVSLSEVDAVDCDEASSNTFLRCDNPPSDVIEISDSEDDEVEEGSAC